MQGAAPGSARPCGAPRRSWPCPAPRPQNPRGPEADGWTAQVFRAPELELGRETRGPQGKRTEIRHVEKDAEIFDCGSG